MRYNDPSSQPGSGSVIGNTSDHTAATTAQFGKFWAELAGRFVFNEKVIFGIMNEVAPFSFRNAYTHLHIKLQPHDMPTSLLFQNNQAAINGIRSVGAKQMILAPGNGGPFSNGHPCQCFS